MGCATFCYSQITIAPSAADILDVMNSWGVTGDSGEIGIAQRVLCLEHERERYRAEDDDEMNRGKETPANVMNSTKDDEKGLDGDQTLACVIAILI